MSKGEIELFVPGRVCLFGEHTDWSGSFRRFNSALAPGRTLVVGTNAGLYARVKEHPSSLVMSCTTEKGEVIGPCDIPMTPKALLAVAQAGGFWSYAAGVSYKIMTDYRVNGISIDNYKCDLPLKKGLSSSAAVCVLVARAFNRVYGLNMTTRGEMEYAYQGELTTPSRCGRMDQACAFGSRPVVMTYDGEFVDVTTISVTKPIHLVLVDLCAKKDTVEILSKLQSCFPFAKSEDESNVQRLLGELNEGITEKAIAAIEAGDTRQLGALMVEAQGYFDAYAGKVCPSQLTAPVLHSVLSHPALQPHIYGGKGVGAGGDGTAQLLCKSPEDQAAVMAILEADFHMPSFLLTIAASQPVRKAVIPAAGFGAGLFPATKCVKPELWPVIDADGVAKPAILLNVEELVRSGIDEVIIVVQGEDLPIFTKLFKEKVAPSNYHRLGETGRRYADELIELGKKVTFVVQERQEGLGHAIACAKAAIGKAPFLIMLGDHIYKSTSGGGVSCTSQLLQQYLRVGSAVIGLKKTPVHEVGNFGCVTGTWLDHDDATFFGRQAVSISEIAEKPSVEYARGKLGMPTLKTDEFLTVFGLYVVNPSIFDILDEMIEHNIRDGGEFQFSTALDILRRREGLQGFVLEGQRFDLGLPEHYYETLAALHEKTRVRGASMATTPKA